MRTPGQLPIDGEIFTTSEATEAIPHEDVSFTCLRRFLPVECVLSAVVEVCGFVSGDEVDDASPEPGGDVDLFGVLAFAELSDVAAGGVTNEQDAEFNYWIEYQGVLVRAMSQASCQRGDEILTRLEASLLSDYSRGRRRPLSRCLYPTHSPGIILLLESVCAPKKAEVGVGDRRGVHTDRLGDSESSHAWHEGSIMARGLQIRLKQFPSARRDQPITWRCAAESAKT